MLSYGRTADMFFRIGAGVFWKLLIPKINLVSIQANRINDLLFFVILFKGQILGSALQDRKAKHKKEKNAMRFK